MYIFPTLDGDPGNRLLGATYLILLGRFLCQDLASLGRIAI